MAYNAVYTRRAKAVATGAVAVEQPLEIVILAAGSGKRMRSQTSKALQPLAGRPLLAHVLDAVPAVPGARVHVVIRDEDDAVRQAFEGQDIRWVVQRRQPGTGGALAAALPALRDAAVAVALYGDVPFVSPDTVRRLAEVARREPGAAAWLTATVDDPTGYGRILRDNTGRVLGIVEERDASAEQARINEINAGPMAIPVAWLRAYLPRLDIGQTAQREACLTLIVDWAVRDGRPVLGVESPDPVEALGINDRAQLAEAERLWQRRNARRLMDGGLLLADPQRFDVRGELVVGQDVFVDVNAVFEGRVALGDDVRVGPNCVLRDATVGDRCRLHANVLIDSATLAAEVTVGPFAHIRPGTELGVGVEIGNFVECNRSRLGDGTRAKHLSYIGDSETGASVNIGAGVITCNYDGVRKHRTVIGQGAFIGSNAALVAPVEIGPGATVGAGSTITEDVPGQALALGRGRQSNIERWTPAKSRRRP